MEGMPDFDENRTPAIRIFDFIALANAHGLDVTAELVSEEDVRLRIYGLLRHAVTIVMHETVHHFTAGQGLNFYYNIHVGESLKMPPEILARFGDEAGQPLGGDR